jgi:hypothetical protein
LDGSKNAIKFNYLNLLFIDLLKKNVFLKYKMTIQHIIEKFFSNVMTKDKEQFMNANGQIDIAALQSTENRAAVLAFLVTYIAIYLLLLLLGKWIWNNMVVEMFSVVRPVDSIFNILGLAILVKLIIY